MTWAIIVREKVFFSFNKSFFILKGLIITKKMLRMSSMFLELTISDGLYWSLKLT